MGQGSSLVWAVVWMPWLAVIVLDLVREPRDVRGSLFAVGLALLMSLTAGRLPELDGRAAFVMLLGFVLLANTAWKGVAARRRRGFLRSWAVANGFRPAKVRRDRAETRLPSPLLKLPMIAQTRWPRIDGLMERCDEDGRDWLVFDLLTTARGDGIGTSNHRNSATVVSLHQPGARMPRFSLRPKHLHPSRHGDGDGAAEFVDLPRHGQPSDPYRVLGFETGNLAALFDGDLTATLASKAGWIIEGEGEWLAAMFYEGAVDSARTYGGLLIASAGQMSDHVAEASSLLGAISRRAHRRAYLPAAGA